MLPLLVLLGTIAGAWYLLIVRPQKEQQTRHGRLVERLQVGDHVLTVGGIYGRVVAIEPATVVLELAPGLTSRIATDGIARIVHGAEAALPTHVTDGGAPTPPIPRQALEDDMQQHPDQHQHSPAQQAPAAGQFAPPASLPPQPFAAAPAAIDPRSMSPAPTPPQPQYQQQYQQPPLPAHAAYHAAQHAAPPAPLAAPPAPGETTTLRAQVLPAVPTFEPRPWGDVAPRGAVAPVVRHAPQHAPVTPVAHHAPQYAPVAPMPLHTPFAQPQHVHYAQAPVHPAPSMPYAPAMQQQYAQPLQPHHVQHVQQVQQVQPMHAPQPLHAVAPAPPEPAAHQEAAAAPDGRRHSRAPKGMGSSLRLDDPSLRDTIARARGERAELAEEYRKLTAPLVEVEPAGSPHAAPAWQQQPQGHAQLVGHDANGVPLFATPGAPGVQPLAQYPAPAHVPTEGAAVVPRPAVGMPITGVDAAFQRRTPLTQPMPAVHAAAPVEHAHA